MSLSKGFLELITKIGNTEQPLSQRLKHDQMSGKMRTTRVMKGHRKDFRSIQVGTDRLRELGNVYTVSSGSINRSDKKDLMLASNALRASQASYGEVEIKIRLLNFIRKGITEIISQSVHYPNIFYASA